MLAAALLGGSSTALAGPDDPPTRSAPWTSLGTYEANGGVRYEVFVAPARPQGNCLAVDVKLDEEGLASDKALGDAGLRRGHFVESCFGAGTLELAPFDVPYFLLAWNVGSFAETKVLVGLMPDEHYTLTGRLAGGGSVMTTAGPDGVAVLTYATSEKLRRLIARDPDGTRIGTCRATERSLNVACV
jgi:hypothetical protein